MAVGPPLARIDLNLLHVLDVLLKERNVTRAARALGLSQPATSNALARLRELLGDPLLVRTPRGMTPTARALALEGPLRDALARLSDAVRESGPFEPATARRAFTLAATDYVQFVLLGPLLRRLRAVAPGVVLNVVPMAFDAAVTELEAGTLDLLLSGVPSQKKGLTRRTLFRDRIVCMVARDHAHAGGAFTLERYLALTHVEVVTVPGPTLADQTLSKMGRQRKVALTLPNFLVAPFVVPGSDLCFTLAERIAAPMTKLLPLTVLPLPFEAPEVTVWAYWHERKHGDAAHGWLRRMIAEVAAGLELPGKAARRKARKG